MTHREIVAAHYAAPDLVERIRDALLRAGKTPDTVTREDLAALDEFHTGGRDATRSLARLAGIAPGMSVLDVGCGIGGPARTLAAEFGAHVIGVDLSPEFCATASWLTQLLGMSAQTEFRSGDAADLPFDDASFDVVWSQNAMMNIPGKERTFREMHRVLCAGGLLALQAAFSGPGGPVHLPTFWASMAGGNFLVTPEEARVMLSSVGFTELHWEDTTAQTLEQARKRRENAAGPPAAVLGRELLVTEGLSEKMANAVRNAEEARIVMVRAILRRD